MAPAGKAQSAPDEAAETRRSEKPSQIEKSGA